jgi:hypothetical protein
MKDPLKKAVIAITGDFGSSRKLENMKRWIENNGGRYSAKVEEGVTHLVCSEDHWKSQPVAGKRFLSESHILTILKCKNKHTEIYYPVQNAHRIKSVKIVTYDWLEDSLHAKSSKREGPYLLKKIEKVKRKLKAERKAKERKALKKEGKYFTRTPCTSSPPLAL